MVEMCQLCQVIASRAPGEIVYQDEEVTALHARALISKPAAPVHLLIVSNRHITSFNRISEDDEGMLGRLLIVARRLAERMYISQKGYRILINTGADAGQSIFHLHAHLMGGQPLPDWRNDCEEP